MFVSYSHRDNHGIIEGQKGWVESFLWTFRVRLGELLGTDPIIWWDHAEIRGNEVFAGVINKGLSHSGIFLPILSPSYQTSDWCRKELEAFCRAESLTGAVLPSDKSRFFKVIKVPIPRDEHPEELQGCLGYEFFLQDPQTGRVRLLPLDPNNPELDYFKRIDDLAFDIKDFIDHLQRSSEPTPTPVLYLAESASELRPERQSILRSLRQRGYTILPDQELPMNDPALRQMVGRNLSRCQLSIHLIGADAEEESIVAIQSQLAAEHAGERPFRCLIWIPTDLDLSDEQQNFIQRLQGKDSGARRGAEVLRTSLEALETVIEDRLRRQSVVAFPPRADRDGLRLVYLLCDKCDEEEAEELKRILYDRHEQIEVTLPLFEGEAEEIRTYHQDNLTTCDGVLLFFGKATETWLHIKMMDLRKAVGFGRPRPLSAKAVYMASPTNPVKQNFESREVLVIRDSGGRPPEGLTPFFEHLDLVNTGRIS